jgi:hypothetical protein
LLTACGGGSGKADIVPAKINTAPVLVGPLSMQLTASSIGETNLALQDAENDPLTLSYTDKPNWVEAVATSNQLKFTARPGLFQVGTSKFTVRLSDGKAHADYIITLNVADDPTKWVQISTPRTDFIGQWSFSTGDDLHLYANDTGRFFATDGGIYDLTWSAQNGYIEINSTKLVCEKDCNERIQAYVIATEDRRKRLVLQSEKQNISVTMTAYSNKTQKNGIYVREQMALDYVHRLQNNALDLVVPFRLESSGNIVTSSAYIKAQLNSEGKAAAQAAVAEESLYFIRSGVGHESIDLLINLTELEILPSASDRLTVKYILNFSLKDTSLNVDSYVGMKDFLATPYVGYIELSTAEQVAMPTVDFNTPYYSGFRLQTQVEGKLFVVGVSEIVFTDNTNGVARFRKANSFTVVERNFTWSRDQQQLMIKLDGKDFSFNFINHPINGLSLITSSQFYYPFLQKDKQADSKDLIGNFAIDKLSTTDWSYYHNIYPDNTAKLSASQLEFDNSGTPTYVWQLESDGSLSFLRNSACERSLTYASCSEDLQRRFKRGEKITLQYRNFKIIKKTDAYTYLQSSSSFQTQTSHQDFETVVRLRNIAK